MMRRALVCLEAATAEPPRQEELVAPRYEHIWMLPGLDEDEGFHGFLDVGALTPSLPAIALRGHEPPPVPAGPPGAPAPGPAQIRMY